MGLTLLAQASLPVTFWWEAFHTSVYLINRLPSPTTSNKSPFLLFQKTPYYKALQVFGCAYFPFLKPYNSHKFQFRSSKCIFLGYSNHHKGYKCLHSSRRLYISDTVHFNSEEFPYTSLFPSHISHTHTTPPNSYSLSPPIIHPEPPHASSQLDVTSPSEMLAPLSSAATPPASPSSSQSPLISSNPISPILSPVSPTSEPQPNNNSSASASRSEHTQITSHISQPYRNQNLHPMVTRAKHGIFKPNVFITNSNTLLEVPDSVGTTLNSS